MDRRDDVTEEALARAISADRPFHVEITKPTSQSLVDLHWLALKAARTVGCKVSIRIVRATPLSPMRVTVSRERRA